MTASITLVDVNELFQLFSTKLLLLMDPRPRQIS